MIAQQLRRALCGTLLFVGCAVPVALNGAEEAPKADRTVHGATYSTSHNGVFHWVTGISEGFISTEDGSVWNFSEGDHQAGYVYRWTLGQTILVFPSYDSRKLPYKLYNQSTGESVYASLYDVGGIYRARMTAHTRLVSSIDCINSRLMLDDGSWWDVFELSTLAGWYINDTVVLGMTGGYGEINYRYPNILINYRAGNHARGYCTN